MTPVELETWLKTQKLTCLELSKRLGLDEETPRRWKRGVKKPPPYLMRLLESVAREVRRERAIAGKLPPDDLAEWAKDARTEWELICEWRNTAIPAPVKCGYRNCDKSLNGRRDKKFCSDSHRVMESIARKAEGAV